MDYIDQCQVIFDQGANRFHLADSKGHQTQCYTMAKNRRAHCGNGRKITRLSA